MKMLKDLTVMARDVPRAFGARIVASICVRSRPVSFGYNQEKSHPFQREWAPHPEAIYLHAEIDAIRHAIKQDVDLTRATLYVARWTSRGPALARPCDGCWSAIKAFGIRRVLWTVEGEGYEQWAR